MLLLKITPEEEYAKEQARLIFSTTIKQTIVKLSYSRADRISNIELGIGRVLRDVVTKYINHREQILKNYGAKDTADKRAAIGIIRSKIAQIANHNHISTAKTILRLEDKLRSILPGRTSTYYLSDCEMLSELFNSCRKIDSIKIPA